MAARASRMCDGTLPLASTAQHSDGGRKLGADLTVEQVNEISRRNPDRIIAELTDVAAWLERTKPQGLLYESAMPTMRDAAEALSEMIFGTALILAAKAPEEGCTCHPDFTSQGSPLEGPCEFCCSDTVDAALALIARELPGWTYAIDASAPELGIDVDLFPPGDDKQRLTGTSGHLPAAIRSAVFQGPADPSGAQRSELSPQATDEQPHPSKATQP